MKKVRKTGGTDCPCCGQFAKEYRRKLNSEIAYGLVRLHRLTMLSSETGFHVSAIMNGYGSKTGGGDFAKAALWGLIEPVSNTDETKRTSGMWRLTYTGVCFVRGEMQVPSHVFIYDGKVQGFDTEANVSIRQALHSRFNYAELMADK